MEFTHFNKDGYAVMVDVGEKPDTERAAAASGRVLLNGETFDLVMSGGMKKGDVLGTAQIAGIMAAKKTSELIPLCHNIPLTSVDLAFFPDREKHEIRIESHVKTAGKTGVEMEALTAVSAAALTIYDMCKAVQRDILITDIRLEQKSGGVHGDYQRAE